MDESIYESIARENGVSVESVKKEMQDAINIAFENPNELAKLIPFKDGNPNPDEFIDFVVNMLCGLDKEDSEDDIDESELDSMIENIMNNSEEDSFHDTDDIMTED